MSYMIHLPSDKLFCPYCGEKLSTRRLLCEHLEHNTNFSGLTYSPVIKECDYGLCTNTNCIQGPSVIKSLI